MKPRRITYDAKLFGVELPKLVPASIQERAYFVAAILAEVLK